MKFSHVAVLSDHVLSRTKYLCEIQVLGERYDIKCSHPYFNLADLERCIKDSLRYANSRKNCQNYWRLRSD